MQGKQEKLNIICGLTPTNGSNNEEKENVLEGGR